MRNKIIIVFLFAVLIPLHFSSAYTPIPSTPLPSPYNLGGQYNPIYVAPDPNVANTQQENNLKSTYGLSNYYACYSKYQSQCNSIDTTAETRCLNFIQSCLESKALIQSYSQTQNQIICSTGTGLRNGVCLSYDQICVNDVGQNRKWDGTKGANGGPNCSCKDGYTDNNGQCVAIPVKINAPVASVGGGTQSTPVKQITKKVPEIKTEIPNTPTLTPVNSDTKIITSTEPAKPKSLWARFVGWLGF